MRVTVGICTWNRCDILRQTLTHFKELRVPATVEWELLVVDNNSPDRTREVVDEFSRQLPLRYLFEPTPGVNYARNRVLREATGNYLLFTDDDVIVDADWLTACLDTAARFPQAAVLGGPVAPWFPVAPDADLARAFPALGGGFCGLDHGSLEGPLNDGLDLYSVNIAFRAAAIAGMYFDPAFGPKAGGAVTGDDVEFVDRIRRAGGSVVWSPQMKVRHYVDPRRMTLRYLKRYYTDYARSQVRLKGLQRGRSWCGVPLWLWRQMTVTFVKAWSMRIAGTKQRGLLALRDHLVTRGMFLEAWAASRRAS